MTHTNTGEIPERQLRQTAVKCRFFAQYWSVKCFQWKPENSIGLQIQEVNSKIEKYYDCGFLLLKPLSKITKKDLQQVFMKEFPFDTIFNSYDFMCKYELRNYFIISNVCEKAYLQIIDFENNKEFNSFNYKTMSHIGIDFLRAQGYAVPFMEYSVDDLVSFGWVRLL